MLPTAHRGTCCWLLPLLTSVLQAPSWPLSDAGRCLLMPHASERIACNFMERGYQSHGEHKIVTCSSSGKASLQRGLCHEHADAHRTDGSCKASTN